MDSCRLLTIQWISGTTGNEITLPLSFPNNAKHVVGMHIGDDCSVNIISQSLYANNLSHEKFLTNYSSTVLVSAILIGF